MNVADVHLAVNRVDYFVPLDLSDYAGKNILLKFKLGSNDPIRGKLSAVCCKEMKLSDRSIRAIVKSSALLITSHLFMVG